MNLSACNTDESSFHSGCLPVFLASGMTGFWGSDGITAVLLSPLFSFTYLCLVSSSDRLFLVVGMAPRFSLLRVHEVSKRVSTRVSWARFCEKRHALQSFLGNELLCVKLSLFLPRRKPIPCDMGEKWVFY